MDAEAVISKIISKYGQTRISEDCCLLILEISCHMNSPHNEEIQQVHFYLGLFGFFWVFLAFFFLFIS